MAAAVHGEPLNTPHIGSISRLKLLPKWDILDIVWQPQSIQLEIEVHTAPGSACAEGQRIVLLREFAGFVVYMEQDRYWCSAPEDGSVATTR